LIVQKEVIKISILFFELCGLLYTYTEDFPLSNTGSSTNLMLAISAYTNTTVHKFLGQLSILFYVELFWFLLLSRNNVSSCFFTIRSLCCLWLIIQECEELISKGITGPGQGFDGTGRRLGGFSVHPPPPSLRQAALSAAQKRARNGALLPSGPRKLGGNSDIMSALSPVQAAAMAAERRMQDDLWCGSHNQSGIDDSEDVIILEKPPNFTARDRKRTKAGKNTKAVFSSGSAESSTSSRSQVTAPEDSSSCRTTDAGISSLWGCSACTLLNQVN
jgi:hypothetical protein